MDNTKDTIVVNYAPAGTSTLSPDTIGTASDDGTTVHTNNTPTVHVGTLSIDAVDTVNIIDLNVDTSSPTIDVDILKEKTSVSDDLVDAASIEVLLAL
ncbi:hypothetical protein M9H77_36589 [Catharanthus roseus]|uniref:Uncharacterized protein n=1 Tax=Catharanthus roseus TaxID=4058 RepID=A0ACB9ZS88_CATRO|nr:hypothetical protein M9H77_36589 [Catharanthus roseus]